jgi:hypothetical protein
VRRVAIIATASGTGKTTLGRALAARVGVRVVVWPDLPVRSPREVDRWPADV